MVRAYSEEFYQKLIAVVKRKPILYEKGQILNFAPRIKAWNVVAKQLGQDVAECRRRWYHLRREFAKAKRAGRKFKYYDQLLFLSDHVHQGKNWRRAAIQTADLTPRPNSKGSSGSTNKRKAASECEEQSPVMSLENASETVIKNETKVEEMKPMDELYAMIGKRIVWDNVKEDKKDIEDLFARSIVMILRRMEPKQRSLTMLRIGYLLHFSTTDTNEFRF